MNNLRYLLKVSRPELWHFVYGGSYIGVLAAMREHSPWYYLLQPGRFYLFAAWSLTLVLFNLAVYGLNDIVDYPTDLINGERRNELVAPERRSLVAWAILITQIPCTIAMYLAAGNKGLIACLLCWLVNVAYSLPPLRCKARPVADLVCDGVGYLMPGILGYWLFASLPSAYGFELLASGSLFVAGCHTLASVRDIPADRKAGVRSTAAVIGSRNGIRLAIMLFAISAASWACIAKGTAILLVFVPLAHLAVSAWVLSKVQPDDTLPRTVSAAIYLWIWRLSWWGGLVCMYQAGRILVPPFLGWMRLIGW